MSCASSAQPGSATKPCERNGGVGTRRPRHHESTMDEGGEAPFAHLTVHTFDFHARGLAKPPIFRRATRAACVELGSMQGSCTGPGRKPPTACAPTAWAPTAWDGRGGRGHRGRVAERDGGVHNRQNDTEAE